MVDIISRAEWGARPPKSVSHNITPQDGGIALHYEGPHMGWPWEHASCLTKVRGIQAYHMDGHGWVDIAYNALVCGHGFAFEGRWLGVRSAANGTNDSNQRYYAICFLAGQGDDFTDPAKNAYLDLIDIFRSQGRAGSDVQPHRKFLSTACPGDPVAQWIAAGLPRPGGQPVPQPPTPPPPTPPQMGWRDRVRAKPVLSLNAQGQNVRILQGAMTAHGAVPVSVDGSFGSQTQSSLRSWQQRTGTLAADGVCGPNTWEWLLGSNDPPLLHNGVQSFAVRLLQGLMLAHGATPVTVDGVFGGETESSLRAWQQRTGVLAADGVAGPATWGWLCGV